jgi:hypothetical protein
METFTEDELRTLGLLPPRSDDDEGDDRFSAEEIQGLGIPVVNASEAAPEAVAQDTAEDVEADDAANAPPAFRQFTTDIYDSEPTFESAMRTYGEIYNDPNTSRPFLGLGYALQRNPDTGETTYITPPSPRFGREGAKTGFMDLAAVGLAQGLGNAIELAGAGLERLGFTGATEAAGNLIPGVDTGESGMDALVVEGLPILASSLVGAGLALRATQGANLMLRGTSATLAGETAAAAASRTDAGSIAIGENAMLPILRGVDLEDSEANDVIEARLNLLMDGMLAGGIVAGGVQGVAQLGKFAYGMAAQPLVNSLLRGDAGIEDETINLLLRQLVDETTGLSKADMGDPNVRFQIANRIAELVSTNRRVLVPYLTRLEEDLPVNLDSMSALARGLEGTNQQGVVIRGEGLRRGVTQGGGTRTMAAVNEPSDTLEQQTREYLEQVGGETAADQTRTMADAADALAGSGRREVLDAQTSLADATANYQRSATDLVADLANDIELADEIDRLSRITGTEIDTTRTAAREDILENLETAYVQMRVQKNALYSSIEGGPIDTGAIYDVLSNVQLDELSRQATSLQRTSPLRQIAELFQPRMVPDDTPSGSLELATDLTPGSGSMRQETREEVIKRVNEWFARDPSMYNFGYFQNIIRPELSSLASDLFARNDSMAGGVVRQIIKTIDDDMVDFVARTDPNLADAAVEAKRYYEEEFAPLFRDGRLQDYADLYDGTIGRSENIGRVDYTSGSRGIIDSTLRSGDSALIGQFRDLLARPEAGGDVNPLANYMVADAISSAANSLRASGGTDAQLGGFVGQLRQYSEALNENFPSRARELNDFAARVEAAQGNRVELERLMTEAQERLQTTVNEVKSGELRSFFRREYGNSADPILRDLATASDPMPAFAAVLASNRNDTTATVTALMDRAAALDPVQRIAVEDGLQTAYMRVFRERFLGRRMESGGTRPVNPARIDMALDETQSMFRVGDALFRDTPEVMDAVRTMSELASGIASSRNASPIASMSPTEFNRQATTATNRIIYTVIGPLSRPGTRVRAALGSFLENAAPDERAAIILDNIMADPQYFAELARRYNRQPNNPEAEQILLRAMTTAVVRSNDMGVDEVVDSAAQAEIEMRNAFGE